MMRSDGEGGGVPVGADEVNNLASKLRGGIFYRIRTDHAERCGWRSDSICILWRDNCFD